MTGLMQLTDVRTGEQWVVDTRPDPLYRDDVWVDGTGREWLLGDMRHEHVERVIAFLRRRARSLKELEIRRMWTDLQGPFAPGGDMACDAFDRELDWLYGVDPMEWLDGAPIVRALKAELVLR